jgi:hypothetical protein
LFVPFFVCFPTHIRHITVVTAWRDLRSRMEDRPPDREGSCEYI